MDQIIFIGGPIDDHMANVVCAQMVYCSKTHPDKTIHLYINSPGGYVTAGMAIYDTMQFVTAPVHTLCIGEASSMAAILLLAGEKGGRSALSNSTIMLHQPSGGAFGTASDIDITNSEIIRKKALLNEIIAKHTGKQVKDVIAKTDRDFYLDPKAAKSWGIIDSIKTKQQK